MAKVVYRYGIHVEDGITGLEIPKNAEILYFGYQAERNEFSVWALVDSDQKNNNFRRFVFTGTGIDIPQSKQEKLDYVGSVIMPDGYHTFHLFELVLI